MNLSPNQYKTTHIIIVETLLSLIDGQALENPSLIEENIFLPLLNSSLVLSEIKIFASTATPIDKITAAAPDSVKVIGIILKTARSKSE